MVLMVELAASLGPTQSRGLWQDDHTFVIDQLVLGLAQPPEKWTLTFDRDKLNVRIKFGGQPEISIEGESGG